MYRVHKNDSRVVDFDLNKIILSITKAGGTLAEAEAIANDIYIWLPTVAVDGIVKTSDIKEKIINELKIVSPTVAANFESYKKF